MRVLQGNEGERVYLERVPDADVVIVQRDFPRYQHAYQSVVETTRRHGIPLVYESDDLLLELPEDHPERAYYQEAWLPIIRALIEADAVTTTTAPLGDYFRLINPNTWVLPNYLDPDLWPVCRVPQQGDPGSVVIGYMGTQSHVPDLHGITPALLSILNNNPGSVRLNVWGFQPSSPLLNRPDVHWEDRALADHSEFADFFSRQSCDIFLAPLCDNEFNLGKSHLKFLEYSALGVPGIYSRFGPYQEVVVHGDNGFLASGYEEWRQYIQQLIDDPMLRVQVGSSAQATVHDQWLISRNANQWHDLYHQLAAGEYQPVAETANSRALRRLGLYLQKLEQELDEKDALARVLSAALGDSHSRWRSAYSAAA
jgi:glycosyltransferase involved in cell wall biosynthesis